ncbi:MAG: hypothetical protein L6R42_006421, partial [Xanthoria sp. 1 TBL-2021]
DSHRPMTAMFGTSLPCLTVPNKAKASILELRGRQAKDPGTERYQYAPLGEHQIRVLSISIEPGTGFVVCNFDHRNLESSLGAYRAISYCWGDPTPSYRVKCGNGQSLLVTKSAAEILTLVLSRNTTDVYWIDQLCINQEDIVEKSAQVLMMGQIYSSTKQVIAWLGRGNADSKTAIDFVEMLYKEIEDMKLKGLQPTLTPILSLPVTIRTFVSERRLSRKWYPLTDFLKNPWFERAWVMQEVIMACAKIDDSSRLEPPVVVAFEKCSIGFGALAEVLRILETDNLLLALSYDKPDSDGTGGLGTEPPGLTATRLFSRLRNDVSRHLPIRLYTGLSRAWDFKAGNDRDKLYAVRGFCEQVDNAAFRLDYAATVEDVYKTWTTALFERRDWYPWQLHMAGIGLRRSYTSLPSWVPDYSSSSPWVQLRPETSAGREGDYYRASGAPRMPEIIIDRLADSIRLRAIHIDKIEVVFRQPSMQMGSGLRYQISNQLLLNPDRKTYEARLEWLQSILNFLRASAPASEDNDNQAVQDLWQTIISNYNASEASPDGVFWEAFESWYRVLEFLAGNLRSSLIATFAMSRAGDVYNRTIMFETLKMKSLGDRPVFGTCQKRLLGYGPKGMLAGDVLCIVQGMCTPFLLREDTSNAGVCEGTDKRWRVVGACYVHRLMYGEGTGMGEMKDFVVI